jgi:diguanylate cyclase (GGDEF)-like protein
MAGYGDSRSRSARLAAMTAMRRGRSHELAAGSGGDPTDGRIRLQHRLWTAVAVSLLVAGSAGTVVAASIQSDHNASQATQAFRSLSMQVDSSLRLAIQHEQDLAASASSFVAGNPNASSSRFGEWANAERALARYPEVLGLGYAVVIPASDLARFAAAAVRDPAGSLSSGRVFSVVPSGTRSFYCFTAGAVHPGASNTVPAGYDYCDGPLGRPILAARDSGASAYIPIQVGTVTGLSVYTPVYRGGTVPATVAARRSTFVGWVGLTVNPGFLLNQALAGHPGTSVLFSYAAGGSGVAYHAGAAPAGARAITVDLRNGWTVRTSAAVPPTGLFARGLPGATLVGGVLVSMLVSALVLVLGTGRARARSLVRDKTAELRHQALHDGLTGLPNRALITDRVEQLLARSRRSGTQGAVLFIDIDEFKNINDTLGHAAGDQLLQTVAARLTTALRAVDTVGRLGGDEFIVLIDGDPQVAPELVAERILDVVRQPIQIESSSTPVTVTATIGIAIGIRDHGGELLRDADMALYRAKAGGKNCSMIFQPGMETALRHRLELGVELGSALDAGQFRLVYQPIYNLADLSLAGVETLLRWDHPSLGEIQPDDFIPLLESSGQILDVGRWVLNAACQQMASWHDRGSTLGIAVNVSARQLDDDRIVADVRDALELSQLDPAALMLEITETVLMRNTHGTARRLEAIKALNVELAIDDFGTGYSSLASLQQFPIDSIKIDRAFTQSIERSPQSHALIKLLVQFGRTLGLKTLAEGVETIDQLDQLRGESIDQIQGFLLSRPLDRDSAEALILAPHASHKSLID